MKVEKSPAEAFFIASVRHTLFILAFMGSGIGIQPDNTECVNTRRL